MSARDTLARFGPPLLLVLALCSGCRCSGESAPEGESEAEALAACRSACAAYVGAKCPGSSPQRSDDCVASCLSQSALAGRAGCRAARLAYLACVAESSVHCPEVLSTSSVALEQGEGVSGCAGQHAAFVECSGVCRHTGSVHLGEGEVEGKRVFGEVVRDGCSDCEKKVSGGAAAGSACQAARVCQQYCCACSQSPGRYRARACVDGVCGSREQACELAPMSAGHQPCQR